MARFTDEIEERFARMTPAERQALRERQAKDAAEREMQARLERTRAAFEGGGGFTAGRPFWHGLGTQVDGMTVPRALAAARLDWATGKVPLVARIGDRDVPVPDQHVLFRPDTGEALAVVGNRYTPIHNADLLGALEPLVSSGKATLETGLCLYGGRLVALSARFGDPIAVRPGDEVVPYIVGVTRHDGTAQASIHPTAERQECQNTIAIGMAEAARNGRDGSIRIRHTASAPDRVKLAGQIIARMEGAFTARAEAWRAMAKKSANVRAYMRAVADAVRPVPPPVKDASIEEQEERAKAVESNTKLLDTLLEAHDAGQGQSGIRGTLWGAYNAVTHWTTHTRSRSPEATFEQTVLPGAGRAAAEVAYQIAVLALDGSTEYVSAPDASARGVDPRQIGRAVLDDLLSS